MSTLPSISPFCLFLFLFPFFFQILSEFLFSTSLFRPEGNPSRQLDPFRISIYHEFLHLPPHHQQMKALNSTFSSFSFSSSSFSSSSPPMLELLQQSSSCLSILLQRHHSNRLIFKLFLVILCLCRLELVVHTLDLNTILSPFPIAAFELSCCFSL